MSLFFETLLIKDKKINNLTYHNARLNSTIKQNFNIDSKLDLANFIDIKEDIDLRCKVIYDTSIKDIQYSPLKKRLFKSFKLIESDIVYDFKYLDRSKLDKLYKEKGDCDDIIIVKNNFITDTTIANIAYFDGKDWITPKTPLLRGSMRAYMLENKLILEKDVKIEDIKKAKKIAIMNAIIGFYKIDNFRLL
jgi:4-amino-4-deoxychorismate lyase